MPLVIRELVSAVDFELLQRLEAKPIDDAERMAEVERLSKEVARLKSRVDRAAKNLLLVDADNFMAAQDALNEIRREHERAANALKLAQCNAEEDERRGWLRAWDKTKAQIVKLEMRALAPPLKGAGLYPSSRIVKSSIESEVDSFRALLRRLGVEVRFFWRRNGRLWTLTTGELRAQFHPNCNAQTIQIIKKHEEGKLPEE